MTPERVVLIAPIATVRIAEPTVDSRPIVDTELRDVAQVLVEAHMGGLSLDAAQAKIDALVAGGTGEPQRDAWLGIWQGSDLPVSVILCTTWRGMPFIATIATALAARERGYASSLVRAAAAVFESSGATHIGISLDRESPAMHLFRELGFVEMFSTADA